MLRSIRLLALQLAIHCYFVSGFTYLDLSKRERSAYTRIQDLTSEQQSYSPHLPSIYWSKNSKGIFKWRCRLLILQATNSSNNNNNNDSGKKKGYRFGDLTKSLIGGSVEKITGKPYEFGDLTRHVDQSVKEKVADITGKEEYEFGDLSHFVDKQIKGEVNKFTGKDAYKVGDLSKELLRRVASGDFTMDDLFMLLKALAIFEASISSVSGALPVKLLIDLLNFSLANDVAGKVSSALAIELDKRLKGALLGDENYKLGDATKRTIAGAVKAYTGKDEYSFGDITNTVVSSFAEEDTSKTVKDRPKIGLTTSSKELDPSLNDALEKWDGLSEEQLKDGLDKLNQYVELVAKEELNTEKTKSKDKSLQ
mmetsp:Transcript_23670/g.40347  ORF Transcript_23670/g.40347 Transcript_23670/m.40347 type:complete len:367 (+) Transcript_23670:72-1172(+)